MLFLLGLLPMLALAASSTAWAANDATFHVPFDGTAEPAAATGAKAFRAYGAAAYVPGVRGKAVVLRGKADRFIYTGDSNVDLDRGSCTVWVKAVDWTPAENTFQFFVALYNTTTKEHTRILLYKYMSDEKIVLLSQNAPESKAASLSKSIVTWRAGDWHMLAFTWEKGKQLQFYVDGKPVAKAPHVPMPPKGWKLVVGAPYPGWAYMGEGRTAIDELTFHSRVLADREVRALYTATVKESKATGLAYAAMKQTQQAGNLASPENGAFVLASSFRSTSDFYPSSLLDGDDDTVWRAWDASYPQWLEVRWPWPVRANAVAFQSVKPTEITTYSLQAFENDRWRELKRVTKADTTDTGRVRCAFPERAIDRLRIVLEEGTGAVTQMSGLQVFGPPQPIIGSLQPYWTAWYIWYPEPDRMHKGNAPRYFRKAFTIDDLDAVRSAYILLRSNDYYKAHINGHDVAQGSTEIHPIPAREFLKPGKNVIAIVSDLTRDPGRFGWGELLAELALNYDAHNTYVGTDKTWKAHDKLVKGWTDVDFDDSAWLAAAPYVQPPKGPWGRIPYYPTAVCESVVVKDVTMTPETARPGDVVTVTIEMTPLKPMRNDYVFLVECKRKEVIPEWSNFHIATAVAEPAKPTSKWAPDASGTVKAKVVLPPWAPDGAAPFSVRALDKKRGVALDILNSRKEPVSEIGRVRVARFHRPASPAKTVTNKVVRSGNSLVLQLGGRVETPFTWMIHTPSFEKYHAYGKTNMPVVWLGELLNIDGSQEVTDRSNAHLDVQIRNLLAIRPDARIMITLDLRPTQDWLKQNPRERMITSLGTSGPVSFASEKYWAIVRDSLRSTLRFMKAQPYAGHIIGYRPMSFGQADSALGGRSGNTWQTDRSKVLIGDYNPKALARFRMFLRERYPNSVAALRAAWKDRGASFETATPLPAELTRAPDDGGIFIDPTLGVSTKKYDYMAFMSTLIPANYYRIARLIKEETAGQALVAIHYGYNVEYLRGIHPPGPQGDDNFSLKEMVKNSDIDMYCGAPQYGCRRAGRSFQNMFAAASLNLHDRLYVSDGDYRTVIAGPVTYGRQLSMKESLAVLRRDMGSAIIQGFGSWLSDMSVGRGRSEVGWFTDPEILGTVDAMNALYKQTLATPRETRAEVAVVISGHTWYYHDVFGAQNVYNNLVMQTIYNELPRIGAPFDVYLMDDLGHEFVQKQYKLYVFINPYYMAPHEAAAVERLKRDGKTLFWLYAPGYVNRTTGLTPDNISRVTGITVRRKPGKEHMRYAVTGADHAVTRGMKAGDTVKMVAFSYPKARAMHPPEFGPVFYADDALAQSLAAYPDGATALAARDMGAWKSIYCAVPLARKQLLRNAAAWAGVHLYAPLNTVMDADNRLVMVHNGFEGAKRFALRLPRKRIVRDALTGALIARGSDTVAVELGDCQTRLFRLE